MPEQAEHAAPRPKYVWPDGPRGTVWRREVYAQRLLEAKVRTATRDAQRQAKAKAAERRARRSASGTAHPPARRRWTSHRVKRRAQLVATGRETPAQRKWRERRGD